MEKNIKKITNSFSFFKNIKQSGIFRRFYLFLKQYDIFCLFIAFWQKKKWITKSKTMDLSFASKRKGKGKVYKFRLSIRSSTQYHFYKLWNLFKNLYYFLKVVKRINDVENKKLGIAELLFVQWWPGRGLNPWMHPWKGCELTTSPPGLGRMAPTVGLGPTTYRLTAGCSTNWAK